MARWVSIASHASRNKLLVLAREVESCYHWKASLTRRIELHQARPGLGDRPLIRSQRAKLTQTPRLIAGQQFARAVNSVHGTLRAQASLRQLKSSTSTIGPFPSGAWSLQRSNCGQLLDSCDRMAAQPEARLRWWATRCASRLRMLIAPRAAICRS